MAEFHCNKRLLFHKGTSLQSHLAEDDQVFPRTITHNARHHYLRLFRTNYLNDLLCEFFQIVLSEQLKKILYKFPLCNITLELNRAGEMSQQRLAHI